ncbi:MAG TPA: radical SAM protein, partial [Geobacteraceae bacterium]|nr:radical SAM protein [Geobacteraceae bacterium]
MSRKLKEKADALLAAERGTILKARGTEVAVALAYPNTYHLGMSNLGMHQIYSLLNRRADTTCERVFLPDEEDVEEYETTGEKLFSLESKRPVREFDILAFSVSFEQDYMNVLNILRLSGIPADKRERTGADPLVVLGGICSFFNPEPLTDFVDVVIVGEGEEVTGEFIDTYKANRKTGRQGLLRALSKIPGVYVPEFYEVIYHSDGTIRERKNLDPDAPVRIVKQTVRDFDKVPAATVILT